MTQTAAFDLGTLRRAIEARDASTQAAMFADDATVRIVDAEHPPSRPMEIHGRHAIAAQLEDICKRDMTHKVEQAFSDGEHAAVTVGCRYADGTRVRATTVMELRGGRIASEETVQAWDA